ncbi:hypothetical protein PanWU01x14_322820, partial [Parasponia andersonii]
EVAATGIVFVSLKIHQRVAQGDRNGWVWFVDDHGRTQIGVSEVVRGCRRFGFVGEGLKFLN